MIELGPVWRVCVPAAFFDWVGVGFCALGVGRGRELGAEVNVTWGRSRVARGTLSVVVQGQTIDTSLMNWDAASVVAKSIWKRR